MTMFAPLPKGTRVFVPGGPYEGCCPHCSRPLGDTAPSITGTIFSGPKTIVWTCMRRRGGCGHRWLSEGWYSVDADYPSGIQFAPWHLIEPLAGAG